MLHVGHCDGIGFENSIVNRHERGTTTPMDESTYLLELFQRPFMRLAGPMAWEICRGNVGDGFFIDADDLGIN